MAKDKSKDKDSNGNGNGKAPAAPAVHWLAAPEDHDYPAAASYLGLIFPPERVATLVAALRGATVGTFKSKDIFRASGLSLLGVSNSHVARDSDKIGAGKSLSPLLLVRDPERGRVIIADGYHRLCAVYAVDEDACIPCQIV